MHEFEQRKREILDRVDIVDLVSAHVTLKRAGRRMVGLCPFHSEKTPSFTVTPELGIFKCFGCGKGGDIFSFVQHRENVSFGEAMSILADRAGVPLDRRGGKSDGTSRTDLARVCAWAQGYFRKQLRDDALGRDARSYLQGRGFTDETLESFGVGLALDDPPALSRAAAKAGIAPALLVEADLLRTGDGSRTYDTFRNRIMFPIRDPMKRVMGFGGRTLVDDRAKYLNTRQNALFDKGRTLYGVDLARSAISDRGRAIVVEGYTDCLALHQSGFAEAVATLGTALTESHVDLLRRYADGMILLFDSDEAGQAAADRAIRVALPRGAQVRLARITDGKDPGELLTQSDPSLYTDVLNNAVDALEFRWLGTRARFGGDTSDAHRREAMFDFLRVVSEAACHQAVDVIQRGLLVNQCAHLLGIDRAEVDRLMRSLEPRRGQSAASSHAGQAPGRGSTNAVHIAWSRVMEVVLNKPRLWEQVASRFCVEAIPDARDRRIGRMIEAAWQEDGDRLADVLARCDDPLDAERIAALAQAGSERENYEPTLSDALDRLARLEDSRAIDASRDRFLGRGESTADESLSADDVHRVRRGLMDHRHFAPRRLLRGAVSAVQPDET